RGGAPDEGASVGDAGQRHHPLLVVAGGTPRLSSRAAARSGHVRAAHRGEKRVFPSTIGQTNGRRTIGETIFGGRPRDDKLNGRRHRRGDLAGAGGSPAAGRCEGETGENGLSSR